MKKLFLKQKGFTLVETLVAVSIFSISILGLLAVLTQGISDTGYAKKKMMAGYLAQEGIEYVRNMRDTSVLYNATSPQAGWDAFKAANIQYPITDPSFSGLTRNIVMTSINLNEVTISSTVSWTQGSGVRSVTFSENLYNWIE
jgi:prepilin-type N-terminal cleavage/methylation domain-containing protein